MKLLALFVFIAVPLAEIAVFIMVGDVIGLGATIALVIATAIIGVALLKRQGLAALQRAQTTIDAGGLPVESVVDGVALLIAGAFLLTPGLITDTAGFLLLVPSLRHGLARWIVEKVKESGSFQVWTSEGHASAGPGPEQDFRRTPRDTVIEGEFEDVTAEKDPSEPDAAESKKPGAPGSPWRR